MKRGCLRSIIVPGCVCALVLLSAVPAGADTVVDRAGREWSGILTVENDRWVRVDLGFDTLSLPRADVRSVRRSGPEERALLEKRNAERRARSERLLSQRYGGPRKVRALIEEGHVFAPLTINGRPVTLLVDSGATLVVLTRTGARKLGIDPSQLKGRVEMRGTGNRKFEAAYTRLDRVVWDSVELRDVEAAVLLEEERTAPICRDGLLGQAFLSRYNYKVSPQSGTVELERIRS